MQCRLVLHRCSIWLSLLCVYIWYSRWVITILTVLWWLIMLFQANFHLNWDIWGSCGFVRYNGCVDGTLFEKKRRIFKGCVIVIKQRKETCVNIHTCMMYMCMNVLITNIYHVTRERGRERQKCQYKVTGKHFSIDIKRNGSWNVCVVGYNDRHGSHTLAYVWHMTQRTRGRTSVLN